MQSETFWMKNKGQMLFEEAVQLEQDGKITEAIEKYRKSLGFWAQNGQAQYNLGIILATQGSIDEAISAWRRATWLDPNFKYELIEAFGIEDELCETVIEMTQEYYAKAA